MQTRKDAALRKIVMDVKLPIKTRRAALAEMEAPSRALLVKQANDSAAPANLRMDASRRLPEAERRMSGERAARARRRTEPDEETRRREIDEVLEQAAQELGVSLDDTGGSKTIPESVELRTVGPPAAVPGVPDYGVSSEAGSHSQSGQLVHFPDKPDDSQSKRADLLDQGRALAASVIVQYERFTRCPHNLQESRRLGDLQAAFLAWERQTHIEFPSIDTQKEFPDSRLRPLTKVVDQRAYLRQRQVLAIDEQAIISAQPQQAKPHADSGFWGGAGAGI